MTRDRLRRASEILLFCTILFGILISMASLMLDTRTIDDAIADYTTCVATGIPADHCALISSLVGDDD